MGAKMGLGVKLSRRVKRQVTQGARRRSGHADEIKGKGETEVTDRRRDDRVPLLKGT